MRPYKTFLIAFTLFASALFFYDPLNALSETDYISMPILRKISQYITNDNYTELRISSIPKQGATDGQALVWNESAGSWLPGAVAGAADGTNDLIATQQDVIDAINNENINPGDVNFTGDVEGPRAHFETATNINLVVTDSFIGPVGLDQLLQDGATVNQNIAWDGMSWSPVDPAGGLTLLEGIGVETIPSMTHVGEASWSFSGLGTSSPANPLVITGYALYIAESFVFDQVIGRLSLYSSFPEAGTTLELAIIDFGEYNGWNPAYWPVALTNDAAVIAAQTKTAAEVELYYDPTGLVKHEFSGGVTLEQGHTYLFRYTTDSGFTGMGAWDIASGDLLAGKASVPANTSVVFRTLTGVIDDITYQTGNSTGGDDIPATIFRLVDDEAVDKPVDFVKADGVTITESYDEDSNRLTFTVPATYPKAGTTDTVISRFGSVSPSSTAWDLTWNNGTIIQRYQAVNSGLEINAVNMTTYIGWSAADTVQATVYKGLDYSQAIAVSDVVSMENASVTQFVFPLSSSFFTEEDEVYDLVIEFSGNGDIRTWPGVIFPEGNFDLLFSAEFPSTPTEPPLAGTKYRSYGWAVGFAYSGEDVEEAQRIYSGDGISIANDSGASTFSIVEEELPVPVVDIVDAAESFDDFGDTGSGDYAVGITSRESYAAKWEAEQDITLTGWTFYNDTTAGTPGDMQLWIYDTDLDTVLSGPYAVGTIAATNSVVFTKPVRLSAGDQFVVRIYDDGTATANWELQRATSYPESLDGDSPLTWIGHDTEIWPSEISFNVANIAGHAFTYTLPDRVHTFYFDSGSVSVDVTSGIAEVGLAAGPLFTDGTNLFWVNSLGTTNALTSN